MSFMWEEEPNGYRTTREGIVVRMVGVWCSLNLAHFLPGIELNYRSQRPLKLGGSTWPCDLFWPMECEQKAPYAVIWGPYLEDSRTTWRKDLRSAWRKSAQEEHPTRNTRVRLCISKRQTSVVSALEFWSMFVTAASLCWLMQRYSLETPQQTSPHSSLARTALS